MTTSQIGEKQKLQHNKDRMEAKQMFKFVCYKKGVVFDLYRCRKLNSVSRTQTEDIDTVQKNIKQAIKTQATKVLGINWV